jgi:hypothetical protein
VSGQLSHEEFKHAIKRLCPVSDGDVVCLLRIFDKSKTGQVKYVDFVRFFHERFEDDFRGESRRDESKAISPTQKNLPESTRRLLDVASSLGITEKTLELLHAANGFDDDDDDEKKQDVDHRDSIHVAQEKEEENTIEDMKRLLRVASRSIDLAEKQLSGAKINAHFLREGKQALEQAQKKLEDLDDDIKLLLEAQALEEE